MKTEFIEKELNDILDTFIVYFENKYPDLIELVLKYVYDSFNKNDYSEAYINQIIPLDIIDEYSLKEDTDNDFKAIINVKEYYLNSNIVDDDLKEDINKDEKLSNTLTDIDRKLKVLLDNKLSEDDKTIIKDKLNKLLKRENTESTIKSEIVSIIEPKLNLVSVYPDVKKTTKEVYKFDYKANTYIPFYKHELENIFLNIDDKVRFLPKTYVDLLSRVRVIDGSNDNLVELDNIYINQNTFEIINKTVDNLIFTKKRLFYNNDNITKLYHYDKDLTVDNIPEDIPIALKTLQMITIPKDDPSNKDMFRFILQLIGASLSGKNILKLLPIFYDKGGKGKSTLVNILSVLFNDGFSTLNKKAFRDNFFIETLSNTKYCFVNDEFKFNELNSYNNEYKFISGYGIYSARGIYSNENKTVKGTAMAFLFTNDDPIIDVNDDALIERLMIITLPNNFIKDNGINQLDTNEYFRDMNITDKIDADYKGLSMIISLAINEYKKLLKSKHMDKEIAFKQSDKEKLSIISKEDPLLTFLVFNCKEDINNVNKNNYLTTDDVLNGFTKWYQDIYNEKPNNIYLDKQKLGYKISKLYPDLDKDGSPAKYNLMILNKEDVNTYNNKLIEIISDTETYNLSGLDNKIIHLIKNGYNTINKVIGELPNNNRLTIKTSIEKLSKDGYINITNTLDMIK